MSELDKQLLKLYTILDKVLKDIREDNDSLETKNGKPVMIPSEVYDEICDELGTKKIDLMGIS